MRKYWYIAKMSFQEFFSYRANFALEVLGGIVAALAILLVWITIGGSRSFVGEYTNNELITYFILMGWIFSFIFLTGQGDDVNDDIHNGEFSFLLVRPMNILLYYFVRDMARKVTTGFIGFFGILVVYFFFKSSFLPPITWWSGVFAFLLVLLGSIIHHVLFSLGSIVAFWMEQTWSIRFVMRTVIELAMGIMIPLSLFPPFWRSISYVLPFQFMGYVPAQVYLGKSVSFGIGWMLLALGAWLGVLVYIQRKVFARGVRIYTAPGL